MKIENNNGIFDSLLLLALIWAVEIWLVQYLTLGFGYTAVSGKELISSIWRFALNLLGAGSFVLLMPRLIVTAASVIWVSASIVLLGYHDIFDRALSWSTLSSQFFEGVQGAGFDIEFLAHPLFLLIAALFPLKMYWLWRKRLHSRNHFRNRLSIGAPLFVAYLSMTYIGVTFADRLDKLRSFGSVDRMAATHGYLVTWMGEYIYLNEATLIDEALKRAEIEDSSLIDSRGKLSLPAVSNIVLLQIESLDWRSLGQQFNGEYVVPFFRDRLEDSVVFKTEAIHDNGSADSDFIWLTGLLPSPRVVTYKLKGYPYTNTLADKASAAGYQSYFIHGNSGSFFERRSAIESMNFTASWFSEELFDRKLPESIWGIDDDVVLDYLGQQLSQSQHILAYVVTLSSHLPFDFVPEAKQRLNTDPDSYEERYLNSINYTDNAVGEFYKALPENTLLVMFGDHQAPVDLTPEDPKFQAEGEIVPVFLHLKGRNLKDMLQSEQLYADSTMLAVVTWFHDWLKPL